MKDDVLSPKAISAIHAVSAALPSLTVHTAVVGETPLGLGPDTAILIIDARRTPAKKHVERNGDYSPGIGKRPDPKYLDEINRQTDDDDADSGFDGPCGA